MKKPKGKHYFTSETEQAIVNYCATECHTIRTDLYVKHIQPAFNEMVDKIVYTYKFTSLSNIDSLRMIVKFGSQQFSANLIRTRAPKPFHIFLL